MARPPIYDGVYQERQRIISPTNLVGVMRRKLCLLFEQLDKKFWKNLQRLMKSIIWHFSTVNQKEKLARSVNLNQNSKV